MAAIARKKDQAYGAEIWREINAVIGHGVRETTVYTSLDRLEKKRFLVAEWGEPTSVQGGRAKKFYHLTDSATDALIETRRVLDAGWEGLTVERPSAHGVTPRLDLKAAERGSATTSKKRGLSKRVR